MDQGTDDSDRLLGTVIEALPIGVWLTDAEGNIVVANAAGRRIWGGVRRVGPDQYAQYKARWAETGEPISSEDWALARALAGETSLNETLEIETFDGQRKVIRNSALPMRDAAGRIIGALAINEDITGAWNANEQQERLTALVRSSSDAIVAKDLSGIITDWNPGAERTFGFSRIEAVGAPITIIIPEDRAAEGRWLMELIARGETLEQHETERVRKDGSRISVSLALSPIRNAVGRIVGAATISRDITERRQAEARLREQAEALEAADRRKDEFIAILAHELRNPLSPIVTAMELIRLQDQEGRFADVVEIIGRQVGHMRRLLDDLLDASRFGRGMLNIEKKPTEVAEVAEQAVETARTMIEQKRHALEVTMPEEPVQVLGDHQRLVQVLVNLLTNAAKYTDPGGRIQLHVTTAADHVRISVRDTGRGIAPEMQERIFDLFRNPQAMQHAPQGLGLGLTITRYIVEAHGGTVRASSQGPGTGSELVVILPRIVGRRALGKSAAASPSGSG